MTVRKLLCLVLAALMLLASCSAQPGDPTETTPPDTSPAEVSEPAPETPAEPEPEPETEPTPAEPEPEPEIELYAQAIDTTESNVSVERGLTYARVGDCGFSAFLAGGGASSDQELVSFLYSLLKVPESALSFDLPGIGCSTVAAATPDGGRVFGRNFDWSCTNVILLEAHPASGYASFSTVNSDFIMEAAQSMLPAAALAIAGYYAPLDGMNEKGLAISVNMISDGARIQQKTEKSDLTTTTAVRLLLDYAATVDEALELLGSYDLHGSYDLMIHFAISDTTGRAVAVEYVNQEMQVTETPILTNFYVTEGEKYGIGSKESHSRFEELERFTAAHETANAGEIREALIAVGESNFDPSEKTEWSVIYDQTNLTATWYRRERFEEGWTATLPVTQDP